MHDQNSLSSRAVRFAYAAAALILLMGTGASIASAQGLKPKIWDTPFGTHVSTLPPRQFVAPSCGTNGGPAGLPIGSFDQFEQCPVEADTGLREIWFIFDDAREYVARAIGDPSLIERYRATTVIMVPVILSFLVDADGRIQGYRIFTDSRESPDARVSAYQTSFPFKGQLPGEWECVDLPLAEGETSIAGFYVKERCEQESGGLRGVVEAKHFYKKGQHRAEAIGLRSTENEFESWARVEMIRIEPLPAAELDRLDAAAAPALAQRSFSSPREAFLAGASIDCPGCDLVGVDLRYRDLEGGNLSGADLEGAILHRANLRKADLSGAHMALANFNRADLTLAVLRDANLVNAMLFQANAQRADFSQANLTFAIMVKARMSSANFSGATLNVARLSEARLSNANLTNVALNGANLNMTVLLRADLRGAVADKADFIEASLRDANLGGATLRDSDFFGADLAGADLTNADFSRAQLQSANLVDTNQTGTVFVGAKMP